MAMFIQGILIVLIAIARQSEAAESVEGIFERIYYDKECLNQQPLGVGSGRLPDHNLKASTNEVKRPAHLARLGDTSYAWTASTANVFQWISVDLGERFLITAVATQGRKGSDEYVTEYLLTFSDDEMTWREYNSEFGMQQVFTGNTNGYHPQKNTLRYPLVARYVRFNPMRWQTRISMRIEVYGCAYGPDPFSFSNSFIEFNIQQDDKPFQTVEDNVKFRFKTGLRDGVLFYADGNQGDYIVVELKRGYLHLNIDLGSTPTVSGATSLIGGSLLDDGQWHDVIVERRRKRLKLVVDRLETNVETNGDFYKLDLDKKIYLGGVVTFSMRGVTVKRNFQGCMENAVFNGVKLIQGAQQRLPRYRIGGDGAVSRSTSCSVVPIPPITFRTLSSKIVMTRDGGQTRTFHVSLEFRSFNTDQLLFYHNLGEGKQRTAVVKVRINLDGHVFYHVTSNEKVVEDTVRNNAIDSPTDSFNDGLWHYVLLSIDTTKVNCTVDRNVKISTRNLQLNLGTQYHIGGFSTENSFQGCMRNINVGNRILEFEELTNDLQSGVQLGTCAMRDRCVPNPCEHDGVCTQDWETFSCDCTSTGYKGVTCHISKYTVSCKHFKSFSGEAGIEATRIDLDGSGPLKPFDVSCDEDTTYLFHDSMEEMRVDGFELPNPYVRVVGYGMEWEALNEVLERASSCQQEIGYRCTNSRLLMKPAAGLNPDGEEYRTYAWWVGRTYQQMYYWGGAVQGTGRCECGLVELGCQGHQRTCNCDAASSRETKDSGYIRDKEQLPVMEMYFSDTGTLTDNKVGWHTLGRLECSGDNLFDNVITFRKHDSTIQLETFDAKTTGDIWFQIRTTLADGVILHNTAVNTEDMIMIRIRNGDYVQLIYNAGNGENVVQVRVPSGVNDDRWHTIHFERNRKQAWLQIDNLAPVTRTEPQDQGYRTLDLEGALRIGATVDERSGYVGCIRGLMVNGKLVDLRGLVERGDFKYGVQVGCVGKCDSSPCFNGGTCIEEYSGYTCDCAYTPFRGWDCYREVGATMVKHNMISYNFTESFGFSAADGELIQIGFHTKDKQGILLQMKNLGTSNTGVDDEYMSIEINNHGGIRIALSIGFSERQEVNTPQEFDLANSQSHNITIKRFNKGRSISIQADDYPIKVHHWDLPEGTDTVLDNPEVMYIGNNSTESEEFGFEGCIYRMRFDNIYPLKRAFQDPRPSFVKLYPEGEIHEDMCGFEEITVAPDPHEVRPGSGILVNITAPPGTVLEMAMGVKAGIGIGVLIGVIVILLIILIIYKIITGGVYRTHEARGAELADDADTALVYNQMGQPDIQKRKEWFI